MNHGWQSKMISLYYIAFVLVISSWVLWQNGKWFSTAWGWVVIWLYSFTILTMTLHSAVISHSWQWYGRKTFQYFWKLSGFRKYVYFCFHCDQPGTPQAWARGGWGHIHLSAEACGAAAKLNANGPCCVETLWSQPAEAAGSVRPFVKAGCLDLTCPEPHTITLVISDRSADKQKHYIVYFLKLWVLSDDWYKRCLWC